ncbi:hypothetical protein B0H14DRAFT_3155259 [Mycena olivaceomarginata]|nr:hypothetical protein B0H14DRAFT_3155259 [Mycena olivaceomarginata]
MTLWVLPALPPNIAGCSHAFELMLGAPSIFNWNVGCSRPKIVGRSQVCELSMGAPIAPTEGSLGAPSEFNWEHPGNYTKAVGSFQDVTWAVPSPSSKYCWGFPGLLQGSSHGCEEGASMHSWKSVGGCSQLCRSVMNPAEAGSAFCAPVEGGCRSATQMNAFYATKEGGGAVNPAKGKKHSMPAEEGGDERGSGRVKCIPQGRGGQEGGHKGAMSQVGGYDVFHSTEGRHRGAVSQGKVKCIVQ